LQKLEENERRVVDRMKDTQVKQASARIELESVLKRSEMAALERLVYKQ
jgi:hypothetical protein